MRRKQLIILVVAVMVLGLSGCKKKDNPIETQPSIESITPTESSALSREDNIDETAESFSFEEAESKASERIKSNGDLYSEEELASVESSERAELDSLIEEQGSGNIVTPTIADIEDKGEEEIKQEVESVQESLHESLEQREDWETMSDQDMIRMGEDINTHVNEQALELSRQTVLNIIKEKQAQGIHDFDHITAEVLAGYTDEQIMELRLQIAQLGGAQ